MMKSVPVLLDRVYRLRYDLNAMWDLDHIMTGGFLTLFFRDAGDFELLRLLFWGGLQHEQRLTISEAGQILRDAFDIGKISGVGGHAACRDALLQAGWILNPAAKATTRGTTDKTRANIATMTERIEEIEAAALQYLDITPAELWRCTPVEINQMIEGFRIRQEIREGRLELQRLVPKQQKPQTPEQMTFLLNQAFAGMGIKVTE